MHIKEGINKNEKQKEKEKIILLFIVRLRCVVNVDDDENELCEVHEGIIRKTNRKKEKNNENK